jgi:hypothetical protein
MKHMAGTGRIELPTTWLYHPVGPPLFFLCLVLFFSFLLSFILSFCFIVSASCYILEGPNPILHTSHSFIRLTRLSASSRLPNASRLLLSSSDAWSASRLPGALSCVAYAIIISSSSG